jgi:hypothetical protein
MNYISETPTIKTHNSLNVMSNTNSIQIPTKFVKSINEYSLTTKFFDPNESSPPNEWNNRLMKRIDSYFSEDKILCSRCMK